MTPPARTPDDAPPGAPARPPGPADRPDAAGGRFAAVVLAAARPHPGGSVPEEATLQQLVEAAVDQVGATYGALGVLTTDGRAFDHFVVAGMDQETRERIGALPSGRGVLGLLLEDPVTLRLDDLTAHPAHGGFPPEHPPMRSLVGVPVHVGDTVFGHLYLADKRGGGPFSAADAEVLEALAAVAGLGIANARLAERAERRGTWLEAAVDISTALLSGQDPAQVLHGVAVHVMALTDADMVALMLPPPDDDTTLAIAAAVGGEAGDFEGVRLPVEGTVIGRVHRSGEAVLLDDMSPGVVTTSLAELREVHRRFGPRLFVPLDGATPAGVLMAARLRGRAPFEPELVELLTAFATQIEVALTLARSQERARRLQVQADRDRIARDLHDHVVQRLFGTALSLDRLARGLESSAPDAAERIAGSVDELDSTIAEIRAAIFELHHEEQAPGGSLGSQIREVVRQVTEGQPLRRDVQVRGPADELPADLQPDLLAVVRELVTNVVRHAMAGRVSVAVTVEDEEVRVVVTDDGRGLHPGSVRSGLANLAERAERRDGRLSVPARTVGTQVVWAVRRPSPR